jgi:hypothetical protein
MPPYLLLLLVPKSSTFWKEFVTLFNSMHCLTHAICYYKLYLKMLVLIEEQIRKMYESGTEYVAGI